MLFFFFFNHRPFAIFFRPVFQIRKGGSKKKEAEMAFLVKSDARLVLSYQQTLFKNGFSLKCKLTNEKNKKAKKKKKRRQEANRESPRRSCWTRLLRLRFSPIIRSTESEHKHKKTKKKNKKNKKQKKKKSLHTNLRRFMRDLANATTLAWFDEKEFQKNLVSLYLFFF